MIVLNHPVCLIVIQYSILHIIPAPIIKYIGNAGNIRPININFIRNIFSVFRCVR